MTERTSGRPTPEPISDDADLPLPLRRRRATSFVGAALVLPRSIVRQALDRFGKTRLAFAGAVIICCVALVAVFADLLASDLPIACNVHGSTYVLPNVTHPLELVSYDCARIEEETRARGWALYPLVRFGPSQTAANGKSAILRPPLSEGHPLGTDAFGRDVFARMVHGARSSLVVALGAAAAFVTLGALLGALAGFFGGALDALVARAVEALTAFPTLVLVLVVQGVVEHATAGSMLVTLALTRWTEVARLLRAEVLVVMSQDYVLAARALGAGPWRVLWRHVVPNARGPLLVAAAFGVAQVVLIEAALDFLGAGLPTPSASWGETLSEVREHVGAWWLLVFPGLALFSTVASLNLVGEGIRDALDPRLRAGGPAPAEVDRGALEQAGAVG